ncbi:MAG: hypothetical protein AABY22_31775 [Nanoarchaeota archaeon]
MYYNIDVYSKYRTNNKKLLSVIDYINTFVAPHDCPLRIKLVLDAAKQWAILYKCEVIACTDKNIVSILEHFTLKLKDKLKIYQVNDVDYYNVYINVLKQAIEC